MQIKTPREYVDSLPNMEWHKDFRNDTYLYLGCDTRLRIVSEQADQFFLGLDRNEDYAKVGICSYEIDTAALGVEMVDYLCNRFSINQMRSIIPAMQKELELRELSTSRSKTLDIDINGIP
jgi:hypothetical protein